MIKRYMHNRERHFAMLGDDRVVHPFGWGTEFIDPGANGSDPQKFFRDYSKWAVENSDEFYASPEIGDFSLESRLQAANDNDEGRLKPGLQTLTWTSAVETPSPENNTGYAR